jgi:hypothetical protein
MSGRARITERASWHQGEVVLLGGDVLRSRRMLVWATAGAAFAALAVVVVVVHRLAAWLVTAAIGGAASVIASAVTKLVDRGAAKGRELAQGRRDPITVTVTFEAGPVLKIGDGMSGGEVEYMWAAQQNVLLLIEAAEDQAVILREVRVLVESRQPPLDGQLQVPLHALPLRRFTVDLDDEWPRPVPDTGTPSFPYVVSPHEPEQFLVVGHVRDSFVQWRLAIDWTFKGQAGSTLVDYNGHAFRITAAPRHDG